MSFSSLRLSLLATLLLAACASTVQPPKEPVSVRLLAINDLHGNLLPSAAGFKLPDPKDPSKSVPIQAGGVEQMATLVKQLEAGHPNHVFVAAGDLVGASPPLSALFHDETTIEALSQMGLEISAVGNHEFDQGVAELERKQHGGCNPTDGCKGSQPYKGAGFQYLAASTWDLKTGQTIFPAYAVRTFEGISVAFIGLTLKGTPAIIAPSTAAGLRFDDEAETVNRLIPQLQAQGIQAFVVLIHQGGFPTGGDYKGCGNLSGEIVNIVPKFDPAVSVVVSGHTHTAYLCHIDGRLVTSADRYGSLVTTIDLKLDRITHKIIKADADNHIVDSQALAKDPAETALLAPYQAKADAIIQRVIGRLAAPIGRDIDNAGGSPLGQLVADAQLRATRDAGAQLALMNRFGVRQDLVLHDGGQLTYNDAFSAQPFNNQLVTVTLSGEQLRQVLEQQWHGTNLTGGGLQISQGFSYVWDANRPVGARVLPESMLLNGKVVDPKADYRVTVNGFLVTGGDGFTALKASRDLQPGMPDVDALVQYVQAQREPIKAPVQDRVKRLN